jgi:hypothetical protein
MKGMQISNVCFNIFSRFFLLVNLMSRMPILYDYNSISSLMLFSFTLHYYVSNVFYILIHLVYLFTGVNWRKRRFLLYLYNLLSISFFTAAHVNFLDNQWLKINLYIYLACSTSDFMYYFKINKKIKALLKSVFVTVDTDETRFSDLYPESYDNRYYTRVNRAYSRVSFQDEELDYEEEEAINQDDVKQNE